MHKMHEGWWSSTWEHKMLVPRASEAAPRLPLLCSTRTLDHSAGVQLLPKFTPWLCLHLQIATAQALAVCLGIKMLQIQKKEKIKRKK